jgi:hypothetical protein
MKKILKRTDGIEVLFLNKKGKQVSCYIPETRIKELIEDEAYNLITEPNCNESSCAVNGFCECPPINEDMQLSYLAICIDE